MTSKPYYKERRFILRTLATLTDRAHDEYDGWLFAVDDPHQPDARVDEPTRRRRIAAAHAVARDLRARGAEPVDVVMTNAPPPWRGGT